MITEQEVKLYGSDGPRFGQELPFSRTMKVPQVDSLIGASIKGTRYFETIEGDETNAGFFEVEGRKVYLTRHTPTGAKETYRKIFVNGKACWEVEEN